MKCNGLCWARYGLCVAILGLSAYLVYSATASPRGVATTRAAVGDSIVRMTGPYVHENLAVYLIHSGSQDPRTFITLTEGLKNDTVKITEKEREEVNEVVIQNTSDSYLFLQEGDLIRGGKQDREIYASLILPPNSPQEKVKVFCVQHGRWVRGEKGANFGVATNVAFAPKEVRQAAKYTGEQTVVWSQVAEQRVAIAQGLAVSLPKEDTGNLNDVTESAAVRNVGQIFNEKLAYALDLHPDAVGVAIAVNGNVEEINVYPNHALLRKQFDRLVRSYAVQATIQRKEIDDPPVLTANAVAHWMHDETNRRAAQAEAERQVAVELNEAVGILNAPGGAPMRMRQHMVIGADWHVADVQQQADPQIRFANEVGGQGAGRNAGYYHAIIRTGAAAEPTRNVINMNNAYDVQVLEGKDKAVTYYEKRPVHV